MTSVINRRWALAAVLLGCASAAGCISVETPQIQVQSLNFTGIDGQGLQFHVVFNTYNPNGYNLNLQNLNARLILDGNDVGSSVTVVSAALPPQRWVPVSANVTVPWSGAPAWMLAAAGQPMVNYTIEGSVTVEHYLSIRASFTQSGQMPREFFMRGATNTVNQMINSVLPGFGGLQTQ